MGWYLGHKGLLAPPPPPSVPMLPVFAHFSKFSMYAWGKKRKLLVFTAVYVCVKAKLTLVRFFFNFFFCTFPLQVMCGWSFNQVEKDTVYPFSQLNQL